MEGSNAPGCGQWAAIGLGWLLLWYLVLNGAYQDQTRSLPNCGFFDFACNAPWARASNNFYFGMAIATIAIPLPVLALRWGRQFFEHGAERLAERETRRADERRERDADAKMAFIGQQAQVAKSKLERGEFIQSLGAACDFLDMLPHENEKSRMLQIRQGISKELRDIVATYTLDQMAQILREDGALRIKLKSMLASLEQAKVPSSDADVLREALAMAAR